MQLSQFNQIKKKSSRFSLIWPLQILTSLFIFVVLENFALAAEPDKDAPIPCDIKMSFSSDKNGFPIVLYNLEMQVSNNQKRIISGVSILWLDKNGETVGNSDAICAVPNGIPPTEAGSCKRVIQTVGSHILERLGQETWTEIVNSEMRNFRVVKKCLIVGYKYYDNTTRTY